MRIPPIEIAIKTHTNARREAKTPHPIPVYRKNRNSSVIASNAESVEPAIPDNGIIVAIDILA